MRFLGFLLFQLVLLCCSFGQQRPKLYVFMPTNVRPNNMEHFIADSCGLIQIQVFGRYRDLRDSVEAAPPDAILAPDPVVKSNLYNTYRSTLKGMRGSSTREKYVLVSVDKKVDLSKVSELSIGAVDLLGRREMMAFISQMLGGAKPRKVEPVTKQEELLTILQFQDVDAIFVPESMVNDYFRKRSKMTLVVTELSSAIGLAVLSVKGDDPEKLRMLKDCFSNMPSTLNNKLGVDQWVSP